MSQYPVLRGLQNELAILFRERDDARGLANRMRDERDTQARLAREGAKLWKAADDFLKKTDIANLADALKAFRETVISTGESGLDPDHIPF